MSILVSCELKEFNFPIIDLRNTQIDILFVSETEGNKKIFTVQDTVLDKIWVISFPTDLYSKEITDPSWSNDPRRFLFSNIEEFHSIYYPFLSNIYIYDMDSSTIFPVTTDTVIYDTSSYPYILKGVLNFRSDWSYDKKAIVYISNKFTFTDRYDLFMVYLNDSFRVTSPHKKLTDSNDNLNIYCYPAFSPQPNASKIVYTASNNGLESLWIMDTTGQNKHPVPQTNSRIARRPRFSPDGSQIAFYSNRWVKGNDSLQIYITDPNGLTMDTLTSVGNCFDPYWSPDGNKIIYAKRINKSNGYIYIINRDHSGEKKFINDNKSSYPAWRPSR